MIAAGGGLGALFLPEEELAKLEAEEKERDRILNGEDDDPESRIEDLEDRVDELESQLKEREVA